MCGGDSSLACRARGECSIDASGIAARLVERCLFKKCRARTRRAAALRLPGPGSRVPAAPRRASRLGNFSKSRLANSGLPRALYTRQEQMESFEDKLDADLTVRSAQGPPRGFGALRC